MAFLNRRRFFGVTAAGLGVACGLPTAPAAAHDRAIRESLKRITDPEGTTFASVAMPTGEGYQRLDGGPGWPLVVREDLVEGQSGRDDRRTPLAAFVQFTDLHIMDAQSPVRFEYTHPIIGSSAHRPQETLTQIGAVALVARVNSLRNGPVTGRPYDFMVTTGDNTDNHERIELDWLMAVLNGGAVTPNTGAPDRYEGVQDCGSELYWHPGSDDPDRYKTEGGFPEIPGLLDAAIAPFDSPGLGIPWYCTIGNHDDTPAGTLPAGTLTDRYTGDKKIMSADGSLRQRMADAQTDPDKVGDIPNEVGEPDKADTGSVPIWSTVTADEERAPFDTAEFVTAHLDPGNTGPGPEGHGFTDANADGVDCYYTFRIAPGVTGLSLDTTTLAGLANGSIGTSQYRWVEQTLRANSSRHYDDLDREVVQDVSDELFILFSHHSSGTMNNLLPDSRHPGEARLPGSTLVRLLNRYPNVLAWVNGHTHYNEIIPHPSSSPERGFWEINTASHIDHPQMARSIEVTDNGDGTVSLFSTLLEADSPYRAEHGDFSIDGLASLYRELSVNDLYADAAHYGTENDRNVELLVAARNPAA